jgi:hypothetical protein
MFEKFTEKAIKAILLAQEEARRLGHNFVGTEQILLGLIGEGTGIAAKVLKSMGVNLKNARIEVEKIIGRGSGFVPVEVPFTPRAKRVLKLSIEEAHQLGHNYISTEHLLLGLVRQGEGVAIRVLENLRVDLSAVRRAVLSLLGFPATQNIVEGGNIENIVFEGNINQQITRQFFEEHYIKPGQEIPSIPATLPSAEQSIIKDIQAKNVVLLGAVTQIINWQIVNNNHIINDELVEQFVESVATLLAPNANTEVKRELVLQVVRECANSGNLPTISPDDGAIIRAKLSELSLQEFNILLSSDKKYKKLRNRLSRYIAGGAGVGAVAGSGATAAYYREIIEELKFNNDLYKPGSGGGRDPYPPGSEPPDQDNSQRVPRRRSNPDDLRKLTPPRDQSPLEQSGSVPDARKVPASGQDPLSRRSRPPFSPIGGDLDSFTKSRPPFPPTSGGGGGGGGGGGSFPSQLQNQAFDNSIEQNLARGGGNPMGIGSPLGTPAPEVDASGGGGGGDCGDCGDFGECEPNCDCDPNCFIATAVYGSYDAPQVIILRRLRDEKLILSSTGRLFVGAYYRVSPPLAQRLKNSPFFAKPVRYILDKFVAWLDKK